MELLGLPGVHVGCCYANMARTWGQHVGKTLELSAISRLSYGDIQFLGVSVFRGGGVGFWDIKCR